MPGEVTSPETLMAAAEWVLERASADFDDADGNASRTKANTSRIETMVATSGGQVLPPDDIALIASLREPAQQQLAAADERAAAASDWLPLARAVSEMATRHMQMQAQGAAGEFYTKGRA